MAKIKVGVIGLGHMGRLHMRNCVHIDDVKVVAVADRSKGALGEARSLGIKRMYKDYRSMIADKILKLDAVIISLPNYLHFESIERAFAAGLHVFVEKPMATSVEECEGIVKLLKGTGLKFMVGHNLRFFEPIQRMREAVGRGSIGNLEAVTLEEIVNGPFEHPAVPRPVPEWWFDPTRTGGGALLDIGSHLIDLFLFFAGDPKLVFSLLEHEYNLPVEDSAILIVKASNSSTKGIIHAGWYQKSVYPGLDFRMIAHGNHGYLSSSDFETRNVYLHAVKEGTKNFFRRVLGRRIKPLSYSQYFVSYFKELEYFFSSTEQDAKCSKGSSAEDGLKTIKIISEAYGFKEKLGEDK